MYKVLLALFALAIPATSFSQGCDAMIGSSSFEAGQQIIDAAVDTDKDSKITICISGVLYQTQVGKTINITKDNVTLLGTGAAVVVYGTGSDNAPLIFINGKRGFSAKNLIFNSNRKNTKVIRNLGGDIASIENNKFFLFGANGVGISLEGTTSSSGITTNASAGSISNNEFNISSNTTSMNASSGVKLFKATLGSFSGNKAITTLRSDKTIDIGNSYVGTIERTQSSGPGIAIDIFDSVVGAIRETSGSTSYYMISVYSMTEKSRVGSIDGLSATLNSSGTGVSIKGQYAKIDSVKNISLTSTSSSAYGINIGNNGTSTLGIGSIYEYSYNGKGVALDIKSSKLDSLVNFNFQTNDYYAQLNLSSAGIALMMNGEMDNKSDREISPYAVGSIEKMVNVKLPTI